METRQRDDSVKPLQRQRESPEQHQTIVTTECFQY